jgi:hypothetical protein
VVTRLQVLPKGAVLGDQLPPLEGVAQHHQHFVVLERLGDVVERAALHRGNRRLDGGERRDHDDRQILVDRLQLLERGDAVDARHHHVDDGGVERHRARQLDALGAVGGEAHLVALTGEERLQDLAHDLFVVDDENRAVTCHEPACLRWLVSAVSRPIARRAAASCASGKSRRNVVPLPSALSQVMTPPFSRTMP